jgi:hypothetical protein
MSDNPLGQYENYIFMDPPFIAQVVANHNRK